LLATARTSRSTVAESGSSSVSSGCAAAAAASAAAAAATAAAAAADADADASPAEAEDDEEDEEDGGKEEAASPMRPLMLTATAWGACCILGGEHRGAIAGGMRKSDEKGKKSRKAKAALSFL
jgi:hypothetical protein